MANATNPDKEPKPKRRRPKRPSAKTIRHRPHDALFQYTLSYPGSAYELIELLPADIRPRVNPASVHPLDRHFIDESLRHQFTDFLFEAMLDQVEPVLVYFLTEHQRQPDHWMPLRLIKYTVAIWDYYLREHPEALKLPLIVPILIYNGEGAYPKTLDLAELIDAPAHLIEAFLLRPAKVISLANVPDERMEELVNLGAPLLAMKHVNDKMPYERVFGMLKGIKRRQQREGFFYSLMCYIIETTEADLGQLRQAATTHLGEKLGGEFMTTAERLREEGREKGREEGREKGREEGIEKGREEGIEKGREEGIEKGLMDAAVKMFKKGLDLNTVREFISLPVEQLQALQGQVRLGS